LIAGLFGFIMILVPINSAYSNIGIHIENKPMPMISSNRSNTLYVGGNGSGNYTKIQYAIDNASDGNTVFVYDDSSPYYENVVIDKSINLIGEDRNTTIIDGMEKSDVVYIIVSNSQITNFTIQNSSPYPQTSGRYGILLDSCSCCSINNNLVTNNSYGIRIPKNSNSNIIYNNIIDNSQLTGIWVGTYWENTFGNNEINNNIVTDCYTAINIDYSSQNKVKNNYIKCVKSGITMICSENTLVKNNFIENAIVNGIRLCLSNNSVAFGNAVRNGTSLTGIIILDSSSITVSKNIITNTYDGIVVSGSIGNNITKNNIEKSSRGIYLYLSSNNRIYHNNLINNVVNGFDDSSNTWDDGKFGNYWGDYKERYPEAKKKPLKGIWDTSYEIDGGSSKDNCPLIKPWTKSKLKDITNNKAISCSPLLRFLERYPLLQILLMQIGLQ
jgi:parallel beta-helix repeat protein